MEISPIAHAFSKGEQAYTRSFGFGLPIRGGHAIYLTKYNEEKKVFLVTNLLTVIQWVNIACICFLKEKQPYTRFFDSICFPIRGGDTKSDISLTEGVKYPNETRSMQR